MSVEVFLQTERITTSRSAAKESTFVDPNMPPDDSVSNGEVHRDRVRRTLEPSEFQPENRTDRIAMPESDEPGDGGAQEYLMEASNSHESWALKCSKNTAGPSLAQAVQCSCHKLAPRVIVVLFPGTLELNSMVTDCHCSQEVLQLR